MFPFRLSIVTQNLWNTERWPLRAPALQQFVDFFKPDIFCVQELRLETQMFLDKIMPYHSRVSDEFPGWTCEGNVYWNTHLLEEIEHGAEDVDILEENRRLFWVRLRLRNHERTVVVGTAHLTWRGDARERTTGLSPRLQQTHRIVDALRRLVSEGEPAFFTGDLNDSYHPVWILHEAGYINCFAALGVPSPSTSPSYPTANMSLQSPISSLTLDWILSNKYARPIAAQVPHSYQGDIATSDHWPVVAVYEI